MRRVDASGDLLSTLQQQSRAAIDRIDPQRGVLLQAVWYDRSRGEPDLLQLSVHHLAADAVTWQILLADFAQGWQQLRAGTDIALDPEITGFRSWAELVAQRAEAADHAAHQAFWAEILSPEHPIGSRALEPALDTAGTLATRTVRIPAAGLLDVSGRHGSASLRELILAATGLAVAGWRAQRQLDPTGGIGIAVEHHGRADDLIGGPEIDTSRTVGRFTTWFPIRVGAVADPHDADAVLTDVAKRIAAVPNGGFDFGSSDEVGPQPQVLLNYLGRFDRIAPEALLGSTTGRGWTQVTDETLTGAMPIAPEPDLSVQHALELTVAVIPGADGPELACGWRWPTGVFTADDIDGLVAAWGRAVAELAKL
jgi:mycobactin peptide synthetase MbtF